jgi:hypothetical protein
MSNLHLEIEDAVVKRGELRVSYMLHNRTDAAIYAYVLLPDSYAQLGRKPSDVPGPNLVQTCLADTDVALMFLGPVPPPNYGSHVTFYGNPRPLAAKIDAGKAFGATLRSALPLAEWSETWEPQRKGDALVDTTIRVLRMIAVVVLERDVDWVEEHRDFRGAFDVSAKEEQRAAAERDVSALGLRMLVHPKMRRFG